MAFKRVELKLIEGTDSQIASQGASPLDEALAFLKKNEEWKLSVISQTKAGLALVVESESIDIHQFTGTLEGYLAGLLGPKQAAELVSVDVVEIDEETANRLKQDGGVPVDEGPVAKTTPDLSRLIRDFNAREGNALGIVGTAGDVATQAAPKETLAETPQESPAETPQEEQQADDGKQANENKAPETSGMNLTKDAPGSDIIDHDKWIGAVSFKELLAECEKIAPLMKKSQTLDVFASRQYLFSINDGCGFSTYLKAFAKTVSKTGLFLCNAEKVQEITLRAADNVSEEFMRVLSAVERASRQTAVCGIDISEWLPRMKERAFADFLRALSLNVGKAIFIFRVPFLEKDAMDNVAAAIADVFTVRAVPFVPFGTNELLKFTENILEAKSFTLHKDAEPIVVARIAEEKRDGRFYGFHTIRKIVSEMIYLKQLSNAEKDSENYDSQICGEDIASLAGYYDTSGKSGMEQLDEMIGLGKLKQRIKEVVSQIELARYNATLAKPCIHMRFTGNPGTGKTTVARILGKIMQERNILRNGNFFEYSGRDFCGRYVGETAPKTSAMCRDAYGSVLFIDEAYTLYIGVDYSNDYGKEALATLIAEMENHRDDFLVIMAGYSDDMEKLMKGNAGLESRMPYVIEFPNYTRDELCEILFSMVGHSFSCTDGFKEAAKEFFASLSDEFLNSKEFSNARFVRNLFERTWGKAILRGQMENGEQSEREKTITLTKEDFMEASGESEFTKMIDKKSSRFGFAV